MFKSVLFHYKWLLIFYKYAQNDRLISIYLEMFLSLFFFNSVQTDCAYSVALEKEVFF